MDFFTYVLIMKISLHYNSLEMGFLFIYYFFSEALHTFKHFKEN